MNYHEIVKKLIGPIEPAGESHTDSKRFENLTNLVTLMSLLMDDLYEVSKHKDRHEYSMKNAGLFAQGALKGLERP